MIRPWAAAVLAITDVRSFGPGRRRGGQAESARKELAGLSYRLVGPPAGGRVSRVAGVPGDPFTYYAATASGGVWKSEDGGVRWKPIFDDQPVSSIGSIAIAPSDPNVVYVGSGEANIRGNVAQGNGIYKSTDAGKTWQHVWTQDGQIGTLVVHPTNADVAYAAVLGKPFGPNPERGVYRTRDGGKSWEQGALQGQGHGRLRRGARPAQPAHRLRGPLAGAAASVGARERRARLGALRVEGRRRLVEARSSGKGLPEGIWGKVGVAVAPSDPRRVYALVEADKGGLFRSDDGGETWTLASGHHALRQRAWYYSTLTVDPQNADVVWFPQVPMLQDGGRRPDDHEREGAPPRRRPRRVDRPEEPAAHDRGERRRRGRVRGRRRDLARRAAADRAVLPRERRQLGALPRDGGDAGPRHRLGPEPQPVLGRHHRGPTGTRSAAARPATWWPTRSDPAVVYAGEYLGIFTRYDHRTGQARNVSAWPDNPSGHGAVVPALPLPVDGADRASRRTTRRPCTTAATCCSARRTAARAGRAISGDLTRDDETKQRWSGGPITGDNTGVEFYCTIFAIAESPREAGLVWVGSDDGLVHVTRDGGKSWTNVTPNVPGMPEWGTVSLIEPSPFDPAVAYLVVDNHRMDDMRPYLWKTADYGKTWKSLAAGLAGDVYLHAVREDPKTKGLLFAARSAVSSSRRDDGADLEGAEAEPAHGRGPRPGREGRRPGGGHPRPLDLDPRRPDGAARVVGGDRRRRRSTSSARVRPCAGSSSRAVSSHVKGPGENPPAGATVHYWLKEEPKDDVVLEVLDEKGALVRTLSSRKVPPAVAEDDPDSGRAGAEAAAEAEAGLQRAVWDLRYEGATKIKGAKIDSGDPGTGPLGAAGPLHAAADGWAAESLTAPLEVRLDPRVSVARSELEEQLAFALALRDDLTRLAATVHELRAVREQVVARAALARGRAGTEPLVAAADAVAAKCDALEGRLHNPKATVAYDILAMPGGAQLYSRLGPLYSWASEGDGRPTQGMREVYALLRPGARRARGRVEGRRRDRPAGPQPEGARAGARLRPAAGEVGRIHRLAGSSVRTEFEPAARAAERGRSLLPRADWHDHRRQAASRGFTPPSGAGSVGGRRSTPETRKSDRSGPGSWPPSRRARLSVRARSGMPGGRASPGS